MDTTQSSAPEPIDEAGTEVAAPAAEVPSEPDTLFASKSIFWGPVAPLVLLDLWSKSWSFSRLYERAGDRFDRFAAEDVFRTGMIDLNLVNYLNLGTVWGLGSSFHGPLKYLRLCAIGVILYFVYRTPKKQKWMLAALSLILAGALGNLYDNFFVNGRTVPGLPEGMDGAVRDFLHFFNDRSWDFPAFNVADSCISVGALTLFILLWRGTPEEREARRQARAAKAAAKAAKAANAG